MTPNPGACGASWGHLGLSWEKREVEGRDAGNHPARHRWAAATPSTTQTTLSGVPRAGRTWIQLCARLCAWAGCLLLASPAMKLGVIFVRNYAASP